MGWNVSPTTIVNFDDCKVPKSNLLGNRGEGFKMAMSALDGGRINIASTSLGAASACLEKTKDQLLSRKQFNTPIADFQFPRFKFSEFATLFTTSRLIIRNAARMIDEKNPQKTMFAAMAKLHGTDSCFDVISAPKINSDYQLLLANAWRVRLSKRIRDRASPSRRPSKPDPRRNKRSNETNNLSFSAKITFFSLFIQFPSNSKIHFNSLFSSKF